MIKRLHFALWLILIFSTLSVAQTEQQLLPAEKKLQTLITQPITIYKGFLRVGLASEFLVIGSTFDDEGNRRALKFNAALNTWFVRPKVEYGITDRLQASLFFPYINQEGSASVLEEIPGLGMREFKNEISQKGVQDMEIQAAYQILLEKEKRPSLALFLNLTIPTGKKDPINSGDPLKAHVPPGQGHFALKSSLNIRKVNYPFLYAGRVEYEYRMEGTKSLKLNEPEVAFKNSNVLNIGGQIGFHVNEWMAIVNDVNYLTIVGEIMEDGEIFATRDNFRLVYSPTLTFQVKQIRINQLLNFPIIGKNGPADPRFQIGIEYVF